MTLIGPALKAARAPMKDGRLRTMRGRIYRWSGGALLVLLLILFVIPLPYSTGLQGLVWVEDRAIVRAREPGFLRTIVASPGTHVRAGQILVQLDNPESIARTAVMTAQFTQAEQATQAVFDSPGQTLIEDSNLQFLRGQLATARARQASLAVRAAVDGPFLLPDEADIIGHYFKRGERIGFIADPASMRVVLLAPEDAIDSIRNRHSKATIRYVTDRGHSVDGTILRITPSAGDTLPSAVMGASGGGPFAADPRSEDPLKAYQKFYRIDVAVPGVGTHHVEERVFALLHHDWEPIGYRWWRGIRRLLLGRLNV
jgi:putative peptide zinc metalloprotease protein